MSHIPEYTPIVGVTGHRREKFSDVESLWARNELERVLSRLHDEHGANTLNCGFATGTDLWAADTANKIGMDLHAYLPFAAEAQVLRWRSAERGMHQRLLAKATYVSVATELPEPNGQARRQAMIEGYHARNELLVMKADIVVAVWRRQMHGGTYHALTCAAVGGRPVVMLDLAKRQVGAIGPERLAEVLGVTRPLADAA